MLRPDHDSAPHGGALASLETSAPSVSPSNTDLQSSADLLCDRFAQTRPQEVLRASITSLFPGRIALVSSFGAESAVLLHMIAQIDVATPVIFIDTGHLFPETLAYRDRVIERLGLKACRTFAPDAAELTSGDQESFLWASDQDSCCRLRKVLPLARALKGYEAWISGRKRFQAATRQALPVFEAEAGRIKVNPLAGWSAHDLTDYRDTWDLPRHELLTKNYFSIGCMPCTSPVRPGENARAGRWRGKSKVECGIHSGVAAAPFDSGL